MKIVSTDWPSRYHDAGYDMLIESLAPQGLSGSEMVTELNATGSQPDMNEKMLVTYIAERHGAGALLSVAVLDFGTLPTPLTRPTAPTGLGNAAWGVWFNAPDVGTKMVRWYKNGALVVERAQDLATNRSITAEELGGILGGDVVQVCIVESGVVGWWSRIRCTDNLP